MRPSVRPSIRPSVFDFSGRFARDILEILKTGGTPHADREGEVQKHIGFPTFQHQTSKNTLYDVVHFCHSNAPKHTGFQCILIRTSPREQSSEGINACVRPSVFDFSGRFATDILGILKIGGTPHADREGEVQKPMGISTF